MSCPQDLSWCVSTHEIDDTHFSRRTVVPGIDGRSLMVDVQWVPGLPEPTIHVEGGGLTAGQMFALVDALLGAQRDAEQAMQLTAVA